MSFRDGPFNDLKVPLAWTAAAALIVCVVVAVVLLLTGKREGSGPAHKGFDAVARPVGAVLSAPVGWTHSAVEGVKGYFFAVSENRRLRAENERLHHVADVATALADDNTRLRAILGMNTDPPIPMVAGRTVLDARGPFARTRLINVGDEKGVQPGNPVMNERGLVGRIVGVTHGAARVLLLNDVASRTPVLIDRTDARAILTGDGGENPRLGYMRGSNPVREGDRVLTSGDGGVIPRGLPVGIAAKGLDGQWRVKLNADLTGIDYVQVLKFRDFSQVIKPAELDQLRMPPPTPGAQAPEVHAVTRAVPAPSAPKPAAAAASPAIAKPAEPLAADQAAAPKATTRKPSGDAAAKPGARSAATRGTASADAPAARRPAASRTTEPSAQRARPKPRDGDAPPYAGAA